MPAITFDRFDGGLDVRQLASSADANRLRTLQNAYVTTGPVLLRMTADGGVYNADINGAVEGYNGQ